jgi:hypothetical protein
MVYVLDIPTKLGFVMLYHVATNDLKLAIGIRVAEGRLGATFAEE